MPFAATGAIIGGGKQASAAKSAAQTQANAANHATDIQAQQFQQEQANQKPWLQAGQNALGTLTGQLPTLTQGFDPTSAGLPSNFSYSAADMQQDPAYQFAMQQGQQAIQRSAAAQGNALGGGTLKALDQYATGTANQFYNQDYTRAQNTYQQNYGNAFNTFGTNQSNAFNRLASVAGVGQTANTQLGQAGQNYANQAGNNALAAGNAGSAGIIGASNGLNSAWGGAAGALSHMASQGQNPFSGSYWKNTLGMGGSSGGGSGISSGGGTGITDSSGSYLGE